MVFPNSMRTVFQIGYYGSYLDENKGSLIYETASVLIYLLGYGHLTHNWILNNVHVCAATFAIGVIQSVVWIGDDG